MPVLRNRLDFTLGLALRGFILLLLISSKTISFAQETSGSISGLVKDALGVPIPGATILAIHTPSGTRYSTLSSSKGRYILPGLKIGGPYQVKVTYIGLKPEIREDIQVNLGGSITLSFVMTDNTTKLSEVLVKVSKQNPHVNSYGSGSNFSRQTIQNTPTANHSIQDITRLTPQGSKDNSFGGSNFRYNNVTIDGAINNDAIGFSPSLGGITGSSGMPGSSTRTNPISLDAIQDIQVYLAPYDVKIGNFTGGSINAVTRSGTNLISGSIYVFGRNAWITGPNRAGDGFEEPRSFYEYQAGLRLGLPLIKNKLFLFTNEEQTKREDPLIITAGSSEASQSISLTDAKAIADTTLSRYQFNAGSYGAYTIYSQSTKFFNRLDYNLDDRNQFSLRNNTIFSQSTNLERDQQDFRFGSIDYLQTNNQTSTVLEWKDRVSNALSNSFIAGYTYIHDFRTPKSDPTFPQIQITGETPGTTIFLGTDREAAIFNFKQRTTEITDNLSWYRGKHTILFGTHNELYNIDYGFVNSWNGRVEFPSIQAYLQNLPSRARGSYAYGNDDRSYLLSHPSSKFHINFYSIYAQDEIQITDRFKITPGLRLDYTNVPRKQPLSPKITNPAINSDAFAGTTFTTTPLYKITENYLGNIQASPRIGFRYEPEAISGLVLRGGLGEFTSRIPLAWLGYAFYNNGINYASFDKKADATGLLANGIDPIATRNADGIQGYASRSINPHDPNSGQTQVDVIDNKFFLPKILRGSIALDYTDGIGFKYTLEGIYSKTIKDIKFQQVNVKDIPTYALYDSSTRYQPIYQGGNINPYLSNAYELSNTTQGYRYSITFTITRSFPLGIDFTSSYTYSEAKDVSNGIRNSQESNFQLNQALSPNNPGLAYSNFDLRHRIITSLSYHKNWGRKSTSLFNLFFSAQSGSPFTYGFIGSNFQGLGQQVSLAYIPRIGETQRFFRDYYQNVLTGAFTEIANPNSPPPNSIVIRAQDQAQAFDNFINGNAYLSSRRGLYTERNAARTPWNVQADVRLAHDIYFTSAERGSIHKTLTFSVDIINFTNLLYKHWGVQYFSPNTYNSTSSVGLTAAIPSVYAQNDPIYTFANPGRPYSVDFFNSRYQFQLGARYSF